MGTRAAVIVKQPNKTFRGIIIFFDGYVKGGVGEQLYEFYNTQEFADMLVSRGYINTLGDSFLDSTCYEYGEDSDEFVFSSRKEASDYLVDTDVRYVWNGKEWRVGGHSLAKALGKDLNVKPKDASEQVWRVRALDVATKLDNVNEKLLKVKKILEGIVHVGYADDLWVEKAMKALSILRE